MAVLFRVQEHIKERIKLLTTPIHTSKSELPTNSRA
jgi:hypothetical protein